MSDGKSNSGAPLATKMRRFAIVGVANTLIDIAAFALLVAVSVAPLAANIGSWLVAVAFSYLVNSRWSFERNGSVPELRSFIRFIGLGALISLGISSGAIVALASVIGVWPAKLLGVAVAAILNFIAARWSIENRLR